MSISHLSIIIIQIINVHLPGLKSIVNSRSPFLHVGFLSQEGREKLNGAPYLGVSLSMALNVITN